jgi:two-component system NtrC family sensor kinase
MNQKITGLNSSRMKNLFMLAFGLLFTTGPCLAQYKREMDSLGKAWAKNRQDTTLIKLWIVKGSLLFRENADSGTAYINMARALAGKIHNTKAEISAAAAYALLLNQRGDLPGSLKIIFGILPQVIRDNNPRIVAQCYNTLGLDYATLKNYEKSLHYFQLYKQTADHAKLYTMQEAASNNIAREYLEMGKTDSAFYYVSSAFRVISRSKDTIQVGFLIRDLGMIEVLKGNIKKSINYFLKSLAAIPKSGNHYLASEDERRMAESYFTLHKSDSCVFFAKKAYDEAKTAQELELVMLATNLLAKQYEALDDYKNAYSYGRLAQQAKDSLFSQQKTLAVQNLTFSEEQRQQQLEQSKAQLQNRIKFYTLAGILGVVVLVSIILLYANGQRKKANVVLQQRNEQIESQHKALEKTLTELKNTQTQLVQSEKMASLGELTAGIAHEIQNPLNFVNNFSEVNTELIAELLDEAKKGDWEEVQSIAAGIKENQQKINHHGKRADFIVKGMLEHSRNSKGEKTLTNINVLAEEFFKLSYHGLRAKDKNFNAEFVMNFDKTLPNLEVVQQDIGRVLLNLFNNAFYAVNEKRKTTDATYKPIVEITTFAPPSGPKDSFGGGWGILVRDNGNGIPDAIKDKIMQPFFTTKPTGEGTGLGLSLSYDIVVKGHGGSITVDTEEGKGSKFTIQLPIY